jgi:hypothetical protein
MVVKADSLPYKIVGSYPYYYKVRCPYYYKVPTRIYRGCE